MKIIILCWLGQFVGIILAHAQPDSGTINKPKTLLYAGAQIHSGFIIPHSEDIVNLAGSRPVGGELSFSRIRLSQRAYEACHCTARVGAYLSYFDFGNKDILGSQWGGGAFFEPLLVYGQRGQLSVKATAGLSYLTKVYNAESNPTNLFFSMPLSFWLGLGFNGYLRLDNRWHLVASANYNHISNGGTRQPNKGMNFPTASVGLQYALQATALANRRYRQRLPLTNRWTSRITFMGSVRVLPETDAFPQDVRPVWGAMLTTGYRLNHFHALTGGLEFLHDGFVRGSIVRDSLGINASQLALLAGYELWQGRYRFTIHAGWNILEPGYPYTQRFFQRYQLLYRLTDRLVAGVGLKSHAQVAQGFDARIGMSF